MEYENSKKFGDIAEENILNRIRIKYPHAYIDDNSHPNSNWDIFIPEINDGVEVKMDYKSKETGNLVVEVEMNDKPSALSITKSKYWVFVTGYRYIWIKPIQIYRFLEQHPYYNRVSFVGEGDNTSKKAYLINHDIFVKWIYSLDKEDGWVEMIKPTDELYFNNMKKLFN